MAGSTENKAKLPSWAGAWAWAELGNKQIFIILLCKIYLEFPDEVPMDKNFL